MKISKITSTFLILLCTTFVITPQLRSGQARAFEPVSILLASAAVGLGKLLYHALDAALTPRDILLQDKNSTGLSLVQLGYGPLKGQYAVCDEPRGAKNIFEDELSASIYLKDQTDKRIQAAKKKLGIL